MSNEGPKKNPSSFHHYEKGSINYGPYGLLEKGASRGIKDYEEQLEINSKELAGKDVLNLGSGSQLQFEKELKDQGIDARVVSVSPEYSEQEHRARVTSKKPEDAKIVAALGQELPFKDKSFDIVLALHVTEHLKTQQVYKALVREIVRVLRVGGEARIFPIHAGYFTGFDPVEEILNAKITLEKSVWSTRIGGDDYSGDKDMGSRPPRGLIRNHGYQLPLQRLIIKKTDRE